MVNKDMDFQKYEYIVKDKVLTEIDLQSEQARKTVQEILRYSGVLGLDPHFYAIDKIWHDKINELSSAFSSLDRSLFAIELSGEERTFSENLFGLCLIDATRKLNKQAVDLMMEYYNKVQSYIHDQSVVKQITYRLKPIFRLSPISSSERKEFDDLEKKINDCLKKLWKFEIKDEAISSIKDYIDDSNYSIFEIHDIIYGKLRASLSIFGTLMEPLLSELISYYPDVAKIESLANRKKQLDNLISSGVTLNLEECGQLLIKEYDLLEYLNALLKKRIPNITEEENLQLYEKLTQLSKKGINSLDEYRAIINELNDMFDYLLSKCPNQENTIEGYTQVYEKFII